MSPEFTALILAGGFATRLWPLTEHRAKPLLPIGGKTLLQHIIDKIPKNIEIIISTNQAYAKDFQKFGKLFVEDSEHDQQKRGALLSLSLAIKTLKIQTPLLVIAGDNYFSFDFGDFLKTYQGNTVLVASQCNSKKQLQQCGVLTINKNQWLISFVEKPQNPQSNLVSTGCYCFAPSDFRFLHEYAEKKPDNIGGVFEYLLQQNVPVQVFVSEKPWIDIGSFGNFQKARQLMLGKSRLLSSKASIQNSNIGDTVEINEDCVIEHSTLYNVLIFKNCTIKNCEIRNCVIDEGCVLENIDLDHKMIRKGTVMRG